MSRFKFNPKANGFDLMNALWLAELSALAYRPLAEVGRYLQDEQGFSQYQPLEVRDTQAFLAANEEVVILAFRGTVTMADWMTDLKVRLTPSRTGRVHFGFNQALEDVWLDLYDTVCTWKGPEQALWVTGHSLGGALATLAADQLTDAGVDVNGLYTFGQPRVGDSVFARNFERKLGRAAFRFINDEDLVTRIPPPPMYRHVGRPCFFDRDGALVQEDVFARWWRSVSESVAVRSSAEASRWRGQNPGGISDHSLNHYLKYLRQTLERQGGHPETFKEYINS